MRLRALLTALLHSACGDDGGSPVRPDAAVVVTGTAPEITSATLPELTAGVSAAAVVFAATGDTPITWTTSGTATPGMAMTSDGIYSGTPTEPGSYTFTITATNAVGSDTLDVTQTVIAPASTGVVLLANNRIALFPPGAPWLAGTPIALTGVDASEALVSIDRRPINGVLYGLGTNAFVGSTQFSLYAIHPASGAAVPIAAPQSFSSNVFDGVFGMDFNPAADRVRVVTGIGMNFRFNPNTGTAIDADGSAGNGNQRDPNLNGAANAAYETAYTNNTINNASITTHYTINDGTLYQQNPSNGGVLTLVAAIAGVQAVHGFDVPPGVDAASANALITSGSGYVVLRQMGQTAQFGGLLDLVNGAFTSSGTFPMTDIAGLALTTGKRTIVGLASDGTTLLRFHETSPGTVGFVTLTPITSGETLVGLDFRPSTGQLYALGIDATANTGTLYLVDPTTGDLTAVAGSAIALSDVGGSPIDLPSGRYGFDVNPAVDRIRVVAATGLSFRVDPSTGIPLDSDGSAGNGNNPDTSLSGTVSSLDNVAYTNGHPGTGAALTTLYGISGTTSSLYVITNPNGGTVGTAIALTNNGSALDFGAAAAFDIPWTTTTATSNAPVTTGTAYAALTVGSLTVLYRIELVTGVATQIGSVGAGSTSLIDIAVGH